MKLADRIRQTLGGLVSKGSAGVVLDEGHDTYDLANWPDPGVAAHDPRMHKHHHHDEPDRFSLPMSSH